MSDEKESIACVTLMASTLRQEVTPAMLSGYVLALSELTPVQLRMAVGRALCECKFMPAPAELRAFAGIVPLASRGEEAWSIVRAALDSCDWTVGVDFGPVVNAVVRQMGGWQWLCEQSLPDLVWRQKEFVAAFQVRAQGALDDARGAPLPGGLTTSPMRRIAAPGSSHTVLRALPSRASSDVSDLVRELADGKAVGR